jgi:hypothetical protein
MFCPSCSQLSCARKGTPPHAQAARRHGAAAHAADRCSTTAMAAQATDRGGGAESMPLSCSCSCCGLASAASASARPAASARGTSAASQTWILSSKKGADPRGPPCFRSCPHIRQARRLLGFRRNACDADARARSCPMKARRKHGHDVARCMPCRWSSAFLPNGGEEDAQTR